MNEASAMVGINSREIAPCEDARLNLVGMTREIATALGALGVERYADQMYSWVYAKGVTDLKNMTNLSGDLRPSGREFRIGRPGVNVDQQSVDGTRKWLLDFEDRNAAETVYIPEPDRGTLCVSSQSWLHAHLRVLSHWNSAPCA